MYNLYLIHKLNNKYKNNFLYPNSMNILQQQNY